MSDGGDSDFPADIPTKIDATPGSPPRKSDPPKCPVADAKTPADEPRMVMTDPFPGASFNAKGVKKGIDQHPALSDVGDFAEKRRLVLAADDPAQLIAPDGCMFPTAFSMKKASSGHAPEPRERAAEQARGFIGAIQKPEDSANADSPSTFQMIIKGPLAKPSDKIRRNFCARVRGFSIYSSGPPPQISWRYTSDDRRPGRRRH